MHRWYTEALHSPPQLSTLHTSTAPPSPGQAAAAAAAEAARGGG
eukprot:CAMPEP_0118818506 /NCGR_PEP_ID=MMETSP1162-20130426/6224_1 /TAXON_ID=33656 /ORGANISM="Phaeocystis Sp, Strain CCMP2710" /LENGTH=43 /DNA_ID= /DNA_START= /DNA_END= /DNA_ORIENTATION=